MRRTESHCVHGSELENTPVPGDVRILALQKGKGEPVRGGHVPEVSPNPPSATPSRAVDGSALLDSVWLPIWAPSFGPVSFGHGSRIGLLDTHWVL